MTLGRIAVVFVVGMALVLPRPEAASAVPSAKAVQAEVDRLGGEIASLDEDYNVARIRLAKVEGQVRDLSRRSADAQQRLKTLRDVASRRAADVYQLGVPNFVVAFLTSKDPTEASRKLALLSKVDEWESGLVSDLTIARQRAEQASGDLKRTLDQARSVAQTIDERRRTLEDRLGRQRDLLRQIQAVRPPKPPPLPVKVSLSAPLLPSLSLPPVGQGAKAAVAAAYALLGRPYVYGAEGPATFDCSGLTRFTWRSAGMSLPHSAQAQYDSLPHVSPDALQPGDLVFFGKPIHHVGMYVGGGQMIHAPETGSTVEVSPASRRDFAGAARPG
ncbi:MAG TPA: NlpC/P60 family protein [Actinomycetota bacterium]|jgi:cell wall-associated NlpC family hydrolase